MGELRFRFEVEKRAKVSEEEFHSLQRYLRNNSEDFSTDYMRTFLFKNDDSFARIRIYKESEEAILTFKEETKHENVREEHERTFQINHKDNIVTFLKQKGLSECAYIETIRHSYELVDGISVELSDHSQLGYIVEVESMVEDKRQLEERQKLVEKTFHDLGLAELSSVMYQEMLDEMYAKSLQPVSAYIHKLEQF